MIKKILLNKYSLAAVAGAILISSAFSAHYYLDLDKKYIQKKDEKIEKFTEKEPAGEIILPIKPEEEKKEPEVEKTKAGSLPEENKEGTKMESGASVKEIIFEIKKNKRAKKTVKIKFGKSKIKKRVMPLNTAVIKKGEGVYSAALRIARKMNFSREEFHKVWFESLVVIHGKVMSMEEAAVVPKGTKIICDKEKGYFTLVLPKGGKLGTHKDLYNIYLAKGKAAPNWLKANIGLDKGISEGMAESALFKGNPENYKNLVSVIPV